jgi:hypothetical protein
MTNRISTLFTLFSVLLFSAAFLTSCGDDKKKNDESSKTKTVWSEDLMKECIAFNIKQGQESDFVQEIFSRSKNASKEDIARCNCEIAEELYPSAQSIEVLDSLMQGKFLEDPKLVVRTLECGGEEMVRAALEIMRSQVFEMVQQGCNYKHNDPDACQCVLDYVESVLPSNLIDLIVLTNKENELVSIIQESEDHCELLK